MTEKCVLTETRGRLGVIRLDRPKALNALDAALIDGICAELAVFEADPGIGAVVITGSEKAFAAGADIREMSRFDAVSAYVDDLIGSWDRIARFRKPLIAAVAGFALGGGCELAMMCDIVYASETAKFGQPEITLGLIPGAGGTQRLIRAVGKAKAMDICLSGRMVDAAEADRIGLVSRVFPAEGFLDRVFEAAQVIAERPLMAAMALKEAIGRAHETSLGEGLRFERRLFQAQFATDDHREGMSAFLERRPARFVHS
jgi:enoyl-CoA hydratase